MFGLVMPAMTGGILMLFWAWAVLDVIATDGILHRNLPKGTWLFVVIFLPTIGALAWLLLGRPEGAGIAPGGGGPRGGQVIEYSGGAFSQAPRGIEDHPSWSRSSRSSSPSLPSSIADQEPLAIRERKLMEREAELARREAELAEASGTDTGPDVDTAPDADDDTA